MLLLQSWPFAQFELILQVAPGPPRHFFVLASQASPAQQAAVPQVAPLAAQAWALARSAAGAAARPSAASAAPSTPRREERRPSWRAS